MWRWMVMAGLLLLGCGPRVTETAPTDAATGHAPPADATTSKPGAGVAAAVVGARGTGESVPATDVEVRWTNPGSEDVVVGTYRVEWPGGSKEIKPDNLILHTRETALRTVRIDASSGDVSSLDPARAHVVVVAATTRPPGLPAADEKSVCLQLDSTDLPTRSDAAERITRAHALVHAGGSEQIMEAAAAYCDRVHHVRPAWWSPPK